MGKFLGWLGCALTAAYLAGLAWLTSGRLSDLRTMELNGVGDFMAGAFGPLAILWLVLGYFQQGIELRQNSKALMLQAEELRNSVEQQEAMVRVANAQLDSDRLHLEYQREQMVDEKLQIQIRAQPQFIFTLSSWGPSSSEHVMRIFVTNSGPSPCTNVHIHFLHNAKTTFIASVMNTGIREKLELIHRISEMPSSTTATISFIDALGQARQQTFEVKLSPSSISFTKQ